MVYDSHPHSYSQELHLTPEQEGWRPAALVVEADVERRLLLAESAELAAKAEAKEYAAGAGEEKRRLDVEDALIQMDARAPRGARPRCSTPWDSPRR